MAENNKAFHKAAQRPAPRFDFETVVDETYTRLPELRDKVFFIDVSQGKIAHPDPDVVKELIDLFQNSDAGREHLQPRIRSLLETKTSYCQTNGPGGGFVMLYTADDRRSFTATGESAKQEKQTEHRRNYRRGISAQFNKAQSRKPIHGGQSYPALPVHRQPRRDRAYSQVSA